MKKEITLGTVQSIYVTLFQNWDSIKENIKLDPKNLYNLISLKKAILIEVEKMQEAVRDFINTVNGVTYNPDGSFKIPEDKIAETNIKLAEMSNIIVEIEYVPIEIKDEDCKIPIELVEALFDFIEVK